jgi:pSer/pThr/pTyr-binding forkhead associated (FHA) protein
MSQPPGYGPYPGEEDRPAGQEYDERQHEVGPFVSGGGQYGSYDPGHAPPVVLVASAPFLQVDDGSGQTYQLKLGSNVVGRGGGADLILKDTGVSRKHVAISWDGTSAVLTDLGSLNGVTVNGTTVQTQSLTDGDVIRIGHSTLLFGGDIFAGRQSDSGSKEAQEVGQHDQDVESESGRVYSFVTIYTSSDDGELLQDATVGLLDVCGFDIAAYGEIQRGSWFRQLRIRSRDSGAVDKLAELLGKVERAAELKYINTPRSENDEREANAIARLAEAMENVDEIVIRTSSILFVKTGGQMLAWVLSEEEIRILDRNPHLMKSPKEILDSLPKLRQESIQRTTGDGQLPSPMLEDERPASVVRVPPDQPP